MTKKLGRKTIRTHSIHILNGKYIIRVSHWHEPVTTKFCLVFKTLPFSSKRGLRFLKGHIYLP